MGAPKFKYTIVISNKLSKFKVPVFFSYNLQAFKYATEVIVEGDMEIDLQDSKKDIFR